MCPIEASVRGISGLSFDAKFERLTGRPPAQNPFTGMVHFLTRGLAKIEESTLPDPSPGEHAQSDE